MLKIANDGTKVIPANGPIIGRKELQAHRDMYFQVFDRLVKQLIKRHGAGRSVCSPARRRNTKPSGAIRQAFVLASFRSLWGHYAPDA